MNLQSKNRFQCARSTGAVLLVALFALAGCGGGGGDGVTSLCDVPLEANLNSATRIGGATTSSVLFDQAGAEWTLYNVANELRARPVDSADVPYYAIEVPGYIHDIDIVTYTPGNGIRYALLAMGSEGIAVVNLTDPANMLLVSSIGVNYYQDGITWSDGGGNIVPDNVITSDRAPISTLAVYDRDPADDTNPLQLLIGDEGYGLHRTLLSNLLGGPVLDADGVTLLIDDGDPATIDDEVYTLQYAGEVPWGGPMGMTLYGSAPNQRLFVAMGYLGLGIFDPDTLEQVGAYNLYTDASVLEDWFVGMDVSAVVQSDAGDPFIDDFTGMPDFRQASFEVTEIWHDGDPNNVCATPPYDKFDWCTPWAAFDRYGKDYYKARAVDVATFDAGGGNPKTIAYIAYGLGGLIAVDVTGYDTATPQGGGNFLTASYEGYAPAVPAKGPDAPTGTDAKSLFPHFGSGMLVEAGVIDVKVSLNGPDGVATGGEVYYSDHFAGLVVMEHAEDPAAHWKDPSCNPTCNNNVLPPGEDPDGVGDHWPDYEFVTSYEFGVILEDEDPPDWMVDNEGPDLLVTGEVGGHGNALALTNMLDPTAPGGIDVLLAAGAGGLNFVDISNLVPGDITDAINSYTTPVALATTDEIGADVDGLPQQAISIGHTEGVDASRQYLYVADGPHGMSVWNIANSLCIPTDDVHLVANTLQDEYPLEDSQTLLVYPTPHAYDVVLDTGNASALVLSQSLGLRRVGITDVLDGLGEPGAPLLLAPVYPDDIFEHSVDAGNLGGITRQDHAYDVVLRNNLAFVSDGSNGLTVYDLGVVPDYVTPTDNHVVSNLGAASGNPLLGRATATALWTDAATGTEYAFVAAGHAGIAVVDITDVNNMVLVKRFEPIKTSDEDGDGVLEIGKADGRSVDVVIVGDYAYFTYDSFGIVAYRIDDPDPAVYDLISTDELVANNISDRTKIWNPGGNGFDYRPVATSRFKLQDDTLGGLASLAGWGGGALGMATLNANGKQLFYVAYGDAGVIKINWTKPAAPVLLQHLNTVGDSADVTVVNGRVYAADNMGGIALIK